MTLSDPIVCSTYIRGFPSEYIGERAPADLLAQVVPVLPDLLEGGHGCRPGGVGAAAWKGWGGVAETRDGW